MDIRATVSEIDNKQALAMAARASEGQVRAVELKWRELIKGQYGISVASFTVRDRQNLKHLLSGFTIPEALRLMEGAVLHWPLLRREPYLAKLPPTPVFRDLFFYREHIQSFLADMDNRLRKQQELNERYVSPPPQLPDPVGLSDEPSIPAPPEMKLSAMVEAARKKIREERETTIAAKIGDKIMKQGVN